MVQNNDWSNAGTNEYHPYHCAFCGEENEVWVDASGNAFGSGGARSQLTEDCAVCCRPNLITITVDRDGAVFLDVEQEYDA
jgi:hypothetical protein